MECNIFAFILYYVKGMWQVVKCFFIDNWIKASLVSGNTVCFSHTSQPLVETVFSSLWWLCERPSPKCLSVFCVTGHVEPSNCDLSHTQLSSQAVTALSKVVILSDVSYCLLVFCISFFYLSLLDAGILGRRHDSQCCQAFTSWAASLPGAWW